MSPRPQYSAREVADRRATLLEAALEQLVDRGPEKVRMKDVADAAEMSVGTVQYYFGSREELLVQAFSTHSRSVVEAIATLSTTHGTPWEKLTASFDAVPMIGDYRRRSQVWIELVAVSHRNNFLQVSVDEVFDTWGAHFRTIIDAGAENGDFVLQVKADLIVDTLIALIDGFDVAVVSGHAPNRSEQMVQSLVLTSAALLGINLKDASAMA